MKLAINWRVAATVLALSAVSCGGREKAADLADEAPPPSYGEEAENSEVFLDTMEVGSRELYAAREQVLAAAKISPGARIADIGAGTGLYSLMFAQAVGPSGVVYAIDIEPRFLKLINQRAADLDVGNVVSVLGRSADITLPPQSVDVVFIADTYHYFEDSKTIMATVHDALRAGGRLIILDYALDDAHADDIRRAHVRFGREGLVAEVESFGFRLIESPTAPGLKEIYMVTFEKI